MTALATASTSALSSKLLQRSLELQRSHTKSIAACPALFHSSFLASKSAQSLRSTRRPQSVSRTFTSRSAVQAGTSGVDDLSESMKSFFSAFGGKPSGPQEVAPESQEPDNDPPAPGHKFAQFGAGCFWGVELAYQRVPGVSRTWVGYTQGVTHNPSYREVCGGDTGHSEVVRVEYDPKECTYGKLLDVFWSRHDPTTLNRQGGDVGTQYRSGIYTYDSEQEQEAKESMAKHQQKMNRKIVTEILPAKRFYQAEEYHQQYLAKGGRMGMAQSPAKGCNDPIRCYG